MLTNVVFVRVGLVPDLPFGKPKHGKNTGQPQRDCPYECVNIMACMDAMDNKRKDLTNV